MNGLLVIIIFFVLLGGLWAAWKHFRVKAKVAIVSLVKEPHNLKTWVEYHKNRMGIDRFYLFADDDDEKFDTGDLSVTVLKRWKDRLGFKYDESKDAPENVRERQRLAFEEGMRMAEKEGVVYLAHIDSDELLWGPNKVADALDKYPDAGSFHMQNEELAPEKMDMENCFEEGTKFHSDPSRFTAYGNGKAIGVVGRSSWNGPHYLKSEEPLVEIPREELRVLHYPSCNLKETIKRAKQYGQFEDNSAGWSDHHRMTRDALADCDDDCEEKARGVFEKRMANGSAITIQAIP